MLDARIAFAVVGAAGINVLNAGSSSTPSSHAALGALLLVCAVLCEAVFLTFGKLLTVAVEPVKLSLTLSVAGALLFAVPTAIEFDWHWMSQVSWQTWALMIYTGVTVNGVAVVLMYDSMDTVDTTTAAAFTALTPVSGTILSMVFIGEPLHLYRVLGMALVVLGVFIVAREPRPATPAKRCHPDTADPGGRFAGRFRGRTRAVPVGADARPI